MMALNSNYAKSRAAPYLSRAQLSYEYLHTNSTTHEFLFGALVELVDNSRDANASVIHIDTVKDPSVRGEHLLCFLDDGCGMDQHEAAGVITFGYSAKRLNPDMVGQYGNGLKSGAMRIGMDFILFTKRNDIKTCVFLSRSFHEREKIEEVIVPMPSFDADDEPILGPDQSDADKHSLEMQIIMQYSPFKNKKAFFEQFGKITGKSGTLVVCYNLKLADTGEPELDFLSDPLDVRFNDPDNMLAPERVSLRAYLSIVYCEPRMKIYIQGKKVRTRRVINGLYQPRCYKFSSARFKARAEKDAEQARELAKRAEEKARDAEMRLKDFHKEHGEAPVDRSLRAELRQLQDYKEEYKIEAKYKKDIAEEKIKTMKEPKMLTFTFGLNLERRSHDGVFVYNNGRLIKMYQKVGPQIDGGVNCSGVLGHVDVPYMILEPTHNKQDFADAREYRQLLRVMGEHMEQYWRDISLDKQGGVMTFWEGYGYTSSQWSDQPSQEDRFVKKRLMQINVTLECDKCLKWRILPFQSSFVNYEFPDDWSCEDNPDKQCNRCSVPEKKLSIPEGILERNAPVSTEKRKESLTKKIEKQQKELDKLKGVTADTRRRDQAKSRPQYDEVTEVRAVPQRSTAAAERAAAQRKVAAQAKHSARKSFSPTKSDSPPARRFLMQHKKPKTKADLRAQRKRVTADSDSEEDEEDEVSPPPSKRGKQAAGRIGAVPTSLARFPPAARKTLPSAVSPPPRVIDEIPSGRLRVKVEPATSSMRGDDAPQTPTVSSSDMVVGIDREKAEELAARLRRCIYYFLPPNWKMTKDQVGLMSPDDMLSLDFPGFFQAYEQGLKLLVGEHQRAALSAEKKLSDVRRMVSALLKSINADFDIQADCDTDKVDEILAACVKHSEASLAGGGGSAEADDDVE